MAQTYLLKTITFDDFKKIKHLARVLDGAVTCVGGRNRQGKSSFIQGIDVLLGGAKFLPDDPIREGADRAVLQGVVETPTGSLVIRRVVTKINGKNSLKTEVSAGPGMDSKAPQVLLDELVGAGTRDALAFLRMKPRDQVDYVQQILGLNFDAVNARRDKAYKERTVQNGVVDTLAKRFAGIQGVPKDTPDEPVSASELTAKLQAAATHNAEGTNLSDKAEGLARQLTDCDKWINDSEVEIMAAQQHIDQLVASLNAKKVAHNSNAGKRGAIKKAALLAQKKAADFKSIPTGELQEQLAQVDEINKNVRLKQQLKGAKVEWEAARQESNALTETIEACDKEKRDRIAAAAMPVDGLTFDDDGVLFNGLSLNSASDAEQRVVAIGLAFASSADLKVKAIRDGSLLDDDALRHVAELVEEHGGQLIIERVGYGVENNFVLEEGEEINELMLAEIRKAKEVA